MKKSEKNEKVEKDVELTEEELAKVSGGAIGHEVTKLEPSVIDYNHN